MRTFRSYWINELGQRDGVFVNHFCECGYKQDPLSKQISDFKEMEG